MRAVVQRVTHASVSVDGSTIGEIGKGLVVLLGVGKGDDEATAQKLADKVAMLRIFADEAGKFNLSAVDVSAEVLVVSQFTLYADTRKGRRPSFVEAAPPEAAERLVSRFVGLVANHGLRVQTGKFQAHMLVEIHNDGPVTICLDA
ncbi:MAG: D-tyrosyl-tRNA(Tyr) deacylase [Chloroflexi bacterium]|nr:D-tyrosyl-tRNA(Tyr) deacylase [Chloroflexota bacterium]